MGRFAFRAAFVFILLGFPGVLGGDRPLAILAPDEIDSPRFEQKIALPDLKNDLFPTGPTRQASERLLALDGLRDERVHFQIESQRDSLAYQHENHDIAFSYVRALIRAQVSKLLRQARQSLRESRRHNEAQEQYQKSLQHWAARGPASASRSEAGTTASPLDTPKLDVILVGFLADAVRFIEVLTNDGLRYNSKHFATRVRFDMPVAILRTDISSPLLDVAIIYRVRPSEYPLPFSGIDSASDGERLTLTGGRVLPAVGLSTGVSYEYLHQNLNCVVSRQVLGPVSAQLERSWNFAGRGEMVSRASVSMSLYF